MTILDNLLGGLTAQQFLNEYWQQKPYFISNAIADFQSPIDSDELAGLACEEDVESRIILERNGDYPWQCKHGPFTETDFTDLPETHWTLLVQECNKYVLALAQLLDRFNFIPNWRVDDIMVSFAPEDGSVGPHIDQYDVFLLQASGKRRWQISTDKTTNNSSYIPSYKKEDFIPDIDLQILNQFDATNEWIAEPGDILYLPPGVAHYGVAQEDCITISIGFRAPNQQDLLAGFVDHALEQMSQHSRQGDEKRYRDPELALQKNAGEISTAAIDAVSDILQQTLSDKTMVQNWFAEFVTTPKNEMPDLSLEQPLQPINISKLIDAHSILYRSEYSRFSYIKNPDDSLTMYIDGDAIHATASTQNLIQLICKQRQFSSNELMTILEDQEASSLITDLINQGKLYFQADDE